MMTEQEKRNKVNEIQGKSDELRDHIIAGQIQNDAYSEEFAEMQKCAEKIVGKFRQSRFSLAVAQSMSYDANTQFNETNVVQYLAELEEYINSLITYTAMKKDDPNAAISSVPLERLNNKEFNRKEMAIDAPVDTEREVGIASSLAGGRTEVGADEDDVIVGSKQLYQKFLEMVGKKQINIVHQSQTKKEGKEQQQRELD